MFGRKSRYGPGWLEFGVEAVSLQKYRVIDQYGHSYGPRCESAMEARRLAQRLAIEQEDELQAELESEASSLRGLRK